MHIDNIVLFNNYFFIYHYINIYLSKVTMVILRDESNTSNENSEDIMENFDVELTKKTGKGLGLSIVGKKSGSGVFISDIVSKNKIYFIILDRGILSSALIIKNK